MFLFQKEENIDGGEISFSSGLLHLVLLLCAFSPLLTLIFLMVYRFNYAMVA